MAGKTIQPWQAAVSRRTMLPTQRYLGRLERRLTKVGFLADDPLYRLVKQAHGAAFALAIELHHRSCESGVGR